MSCGGGHNGNYGLVSLTAAVVSAENGSHMPIDRVKVLFHNTVSDAIKKDMASGKTYERPTAEEAIQWLEKRLNAAKSDPRITDQQRETSVKGLQKRIKAIEDEVTRGQALKGGSAIPTGRMFESWKRLMNAAREDFESNKCPQCGQYAGDGHACPHPDVTPKDSPPPLRDMMMNPARAASKRIDTPLAPSPTSTPTAEQQAAMQEASARKEQAEYEARQAERENKYGANPQCPDCGDSYTAVDGHTCERGRGTSIIYPQTTEPAASANPAAAPAQTSAPKGRRDRTMEPGRVTSKRFTPYLDPQDIYTDVTFDPGADTAPVWDNGDGVEHCRVCGQFVSQSRSHTCPGNAALGAGIAAMPADIRPQKRVPQPSAQAGQPTQVDHQTAQQTDDELPPRGYVKCSNCKNFIGINSDGSPPAQCSVCKQTPSANPLPADTEIHNRHAQDPGRAAEEERTFQKRVSVGKIAMVAIAVALVPWPMLLPLAAVYFLRRRSQKKRVQRRLPERVDRGRVAAEQMGQQAAPAQTLTEQEEARRENLQQVYAEAEQDLSSNTDTTATQVMDGSRAFQPTEEQERQFARDYRREQIVQTTQQRAATAARSAQHRVMAFLSGASPSDYKPTGSFMHEIRHIRENRANARLVSEVRERLSEFRVRAQRIPDSTSEMTRPTSGTPAAAFSDLTSLTPPSSSPRPQPHASNPFATLPDRPVSV